MFLKVKTREKSQSNEYGNTSTQICRRPSGPWILSLLAPGLLVCTAGLPKTGAPVQVAHVLTFAPQG